MIKMILLTGFLGAGKTTFMQELLSTYSDNRVGVIVNDFGEINVDAELIKRDDIQMAEMANGSIFCACIKDKFVDGLIEMSTYDLEYLFIEASGLADPASMGTILNGISSKLVHPYDYRGSVCIIDGENFADLYEVLPAMSAQVEFCGAVIINKADLVETAHLKTVTALIERINPDAEIHVTSYCKVDVKDILSRLHISDVAARESSNRRDSRPTTFVLHEMKEIPCDKLALFLKKLAPYAYRIKGFLDTDEGLKEISIVGKNIHINAYDGEVRAKGLIVISSVGFKMMSVITDAIEEDVKGFIRV